KEARWVRSLLDLEPLEMEHEPAAYAAVVLHREGLVLAPHQLAFCQDVLDRMNRGATELKSEVRNAWGAVNPDGLATHSFTETPRDVQLAHLAAIELHVREREQSAAADLSRLST